MTHPNDWRGAADPAHLFLKIWRYGTTVSRERFAAFAPIDPNFAPSLKANLEMAPDAQTAVEAACDTLEAFWTSATDFPARRLRASLALGAMRVIDETLQALHPRAVRPAHPPARPTWMDDVQEERTLTGAFAADGDLMLIARGPFMRSPRMPLETATFSLEDQFAALKVIDKTRFSENDRAVKVAIKVIDHSVDFGVPHRRDRRAREVVTFAPLADAGTDLVPTIKKTDGTTYIDVRKGADFEPSVRFLEVVEACRESDILIAPELTVDDGDVAAICAGLSAMKGKRPRLLLAGSGLSEDPDAGVEFPFNQASAVNGNGTVLWRHRKVSAYGMLAETSNGLALDGADGVAQLMEEIAWADDLTIADVDGLGRCLVLICQDLQMDLVDHLLEQFHPDWVIVPILDSGTSLGRWPARRARDLAAKSEARIVVVSSLTMKDWQIQKFPGEQIGVAVGPRHTNAGDPDEPESVQAEISPESATRRHGSIQWRAVKGWKTYGPS